MTTISGKFLKEEERAILVHHIHLGMAYWDWFPKSACNNYLEHDDGRVSFDLSDEMHQEYFGDDGEGVSCL